MPFPNFADKHAHEAIITPSEVVASVLARGDVVVPDGVIFIYQRRLIEHLDQLGVPIVEGYPGPWRRLRMVQRGNSTVGVVSGFGIGAPAAAAVLEELIALGVRRFISMGAAGSLQIDCAFGDVVVCDAAIRDEGVSHHYVATEKFAMPSSELTASLVGALEARGVPYRRGTTWTIDTPYRETVAEAESYSNEGVVTVEMEAAALFAVAALRGVEVAAAFVISDHLLHSETWQPGFGTEELRNSLIALFDATVDALAQ